MKHQPEGLSILPACCDCGLPCGGRPKLGRRRCASCRPNRILSASSKSKFRAEVYRRGDRISIRQLIERDGLTCTLCPKVTDPDLPVGHPDKATVDHILPITRGGEHVWANVQVACNHCNIAKRDRVPA